MNPGLVLAAYRKGIFPWPVSSRVVPWVCPDPRAIFPLESEPRWPRSLRKALRKHTLTVTIDQAFEQVIRACGENRPDGTWITPDVIATYSTLHRLGWAHSVEVWADDGSLVGGLYGVAVGAAFAGESMFHRRTDASKAALGYLVALLRRCGFVLLDAQAPNPHLMRLGAVVVPRRQYLQRLKAALAVPACLDAAALGGELPER